MTAIPARWATIFFDTPAAAAPGAETFWRAVTGYGISPRRGEFATLTPGDGDAFVRTQVIGSSEPGVHWDLHVEDVAAARKAAVELGAHELADPMLRSPGGLLFCLVDWHGEQVRPAAGSSLIDQVCVDIAPDGFEREAAFWQALTGWPRRHLPDSPFDVLQSPPELPLRLLLQRTNDGPPRMHTDLACADVPTEVDRHLQLGAQHVRDGDGWVTLRDPAGRDYCVTGRAPKLS